MTLGSRQQSGGRRRQRRCPRQNLHSFLDLPEDVLFLVLSCCDVQALGRLAQTCRHLRAVVSLDCVWVKVRRRLTLVADYSSPSPPPKVTSVQEQCRYALNWNSGHYQDVRLFHHRTKQLPWLQLYDRCLWVTFNNLIRCYRKRDNGKIRLTPECTLSGHTGDVGRFVIKNNIVVSGSCDRSICAFSAGSGQLFLRLQQCHNDDIQAVDFGGDVIVSGSRDAVVKLWRLSGDNQQSALHSMHVGNRIWSLAMNPDNSSFVTGTAGINGVPPLRIWDTERAELLCTLGTQYRNGAGVLDVQYETPHTLLSCGYDTYVRLWDTRMPCTRSVQMWEESYDSTFYCIKSDGHHMMAAGTAHYGVVRILDKRKPEPIQLFYVGGGVNSPAYSVAFDPGHLYIGLDRGINMLDFTAPG